MKKKTAQCVNPLARLEQILSKMDLVFSPIATPVALQRQHMAQLYLLFLLLTSKANPSMFSAMKLGPSCKALVSPLGNYYKLAFLQLLFATAWLRKS